MATGVALVLYAPLWLVLARNALENGALIDNDDAMRLVQIRDWLGGQPWSDVVQHRLDPPVGMPSHWSRLIDLPVGALVAALAGFVPQVTAERLATVIWPTGLAVGLLALLPWVARRIAGPGAVMVSGALLGMNVLLMFQFVPGRIDHHSVQMLLAVGLAAATSAALFEGSARAATMAGLASASMLAIGLETLPLSAVGGAAFALGWVADRSRGPVVARYGLALAIAAPALLLATVPPSRWTLTACDTLSPPWLWVAIAGGGSLALLSCLPLARPAHRLAAASLAGAVLVAGFAGGWPTCLAGPYGEVDPVVRAVWMESVGEALPLLRLVRNEPGTFLHFLVFPLIGVSGLGLATIREGSDRPTFGVLLAFLLASLSVALWQMRGAPFAAAFAVFGWVWWLDRAAAHRSAVVRVAGPVALVFAALPFGWHALGASLLSGDRPPSMDPGCRDPAHLTPLLAEPPGLVLAPIELGPRILVGTPHSVLGAPYHRNNDGNRAVIEAFDAEPSAALAIVRQRGIRYVVTCTGAGSRARDASPASLLGLLNGDQAPSWLEPMPASGPVHAWRVRLP